MLNPVWTCINMYFLNSIKFQCCSQFKTKHENPPERKTHKTKICALGSIITKQNRACKSILVHTNRLIFRPIISLWLDFVPTVHPCNTRSNTDLWRRAWRWRHVTQAGSTCGRRRLRRRRVVRGWVPGCRRPASLVTSRWQGRQHVTRCRSAEGRHWIHTAARP